MILPINHEWRVTSDKYQYILQKQYIVKEGKIWKNEGYFTGLDGLARSLGERMLRDSDVRTVAGILREAERIAAELKKAFS